MDHALDPHRRLARSMALALTLGLFAAANSAWAAAPASSPTTHRSSAVAWLDLSQDSDVERAFAQARAQKKPVLLYWGAQWCPPCNQLKATLFNRQDFIERTHHVIAARIDGDAPGAQKLGARFKVRGYPTLILFNPQGQELTRLPGEVDAAQVMQLFQIGLAGGRPMDAILRDAKAGRPLQGGEWRTLAYYSWDTDQATLVAEAERPALLNDLAQRCPASEPEARTRLQLKALASANQAANIPSPWRDTVAAVLADPQQARTHMDVLVNAAPELLRALAPQGDRPLQQQYDLALTGLQQDATLSRADRLSALLARVELARSGQDSTALKPTMPAPLVAELREAVRRADREVVDGYERQAVITLAAHALTRAGQWRDSEILLKAHLKKSHSPHYLMSQLGSYARQQKRAQEALVWYGLAHERSTGPATRVQWGTTYVKALVELAPKDAQKIEATAQLVLREASQASSALYERSGRDLERLALAIQTWSQDHGRQDVVARLRSTWGELCAKQKPEGPQQARCDALFKA